MMLEYFLNLKTQTEMQTVNFDRDENRHAEYTYVLLVLLEEVKFEFFT